MEVKMSKIKGLLIKDLLQLKSYKKTLLIFMIINISCSVPSIILRMKNLLLLAKSEFRWGSISMSFFLSGLRSSLH